MDKDPPNGIKENRSRNSSDTFHNGLIQINKKAILVLLSLVIGQFFLIHNIADAGELTGNSLLECTNAIRARYHDNKLYLNDQLQQAASAKLHDMQEYGYWAHGNPTTGKMPWDFTESAGYYYQTVGENLALGFENAQEICNAWENSELHLENITNKTFQEVGVAIDKANLHKNGKGILVVQIFGSRDDFTPPADNGNGNGSGCSTTQGCDKEGSLGNVPPQILGVAIESENPIIAFISKNILIFVIICSYIFLKVLLIFPHMKKSGKEPTRK